MEIKTGDGRVSKEARLFSLGQIVATPGALQALERAGQLASHFLLKHALGDWGDLLCDEDKAANDEALADDLRILSAYRLEDGTRIWIITEADRSSTCCLLPSEY
jgi:hypothetical protein